MKVFIEGRRSESSKEHLNHGNRKEQEMQKGTNLHWSEFRNGSEIVIVLCKDRERQRKGPRETHSRCEAGTPNHTPHGTTTHNFLTDDASPSYKREFGLLNYQPAWRQTTTPESCTLNQMSKIQNKKRTQLQFMTVMKSLYKVDKDEQIHTHIYTLSYNKKDW